MGKKRNITMDESQEEHLQQRSYNKYSGGGSSAYDLPEEFALLEQLNNKSNGNAAETEVTTDDKKSTAKKRIHVRSKKFAALKKQVDPKKQYNLDEAVQTVLSLSKEKFDSSIELNLQSKKDNLSGTVTLPHGNGKQKKVAIFSDELLAQISEKKIDFDVLVARPEDMPKLARFAKILGPKGLMPNPKNGTISPKPEEAAKNLGGNSVSYKTEKKFPLIHLSVGKRSFGEVKLLENIKAVFGVINYRQVKSAYLSSSMGPGVKVSLDSVAI